MKAIIATLACAAALAVCGSAAAQTTIGDKGPGVAPFSASEAYAGQIFTVPAGVTRIDRIELGLTGSGTFTLGLQRESDAGTNTFVHVSPVLSVSATAPTYQIVAIGIPGGVPVSPGETYLIHRNIISGSPEVVNSGTDYYADGQFWVDGIWGIGDDSYFSVAFDVPIIPTLTEWAMILFATGLAGGAVIHLQRRRQAA